MPVNGERCELTGELSKHTGEVCQQEAAEQPPLDHKSDQDEPEYEEELVCLFCCAICLWMECCGHEQFSAHEPV